MLGDTQYTKCFLVQFSSSVSSRHPLHRSRRGPRAARPRAAAALGCRRATADRGQMKQTRHPGVPTRQPNSARHGGRCARAAMLVCAVVLRPAVPVPPLDLELGMGARAPHAHAGGTRDGSLAKLFGVHHSLPHIRLYFPSVPRPGAAARCNSGYLCHMQPAPRTEVYMG